MLTAPPLSDEERRVRAAIAELSNRLALHVRQGHRWTAALRRMTLARNVQGSNSIEGIHASVDDVFAIARGDRPAALDEDTERALAGYQLAMTYVLQLAHEPVVIDPTLIRCLHYMVTSHDLSKRPGRYRDDAVYVVQESTGDIVHEGADAADLPRLMSELTATIHGSGDRLIDAAMAHLNLALIHPFKDGNGRMARVLQSLVLATDGDVSPVFLSVEEYLGNHTQAYYDALAAVSGAAPVLAEETVQPEQVRPWIRFVLTAHYNQAMERSARISAADHAATTLTDALARTGINERALEALFDVFFGATLTRSRYIAAVAEAGYTVSEQTATRDLAALARSGLLISGGEKRARMYVAGWEFEELRREVSLGRAWRHIDPFAALASGLPLLPD